MAQRKKKPKNKNKTQRLLRLYNIVCWYMFESEIGLFVEKIAVPYVFWHSTGGLKTDWAPTNCPLAQLYVGVRERTRALDFKGNSIYRKSFLDRTIRSKSLLLKETPCFLSSSLVGIINNSKTELKFENHKRRKKNLH